MTTTADIATAIRAAYQTECSISRHRWSDTWDSFLDRIVASASATLGQPVDRQYAADVVALAARDAQ